MKIIEQSLEEESNAYSLFVYAIRSQVTRDYYLRRLRIFFNYINLEPDKTIEERCNCFADKATNDPTWAFNSIIRFLQFQKDRVEKEEITGATLRNFIKAIKLFCEMSDIPIPWKKITRGLPKIRRHADDRAPTIDEIQQLCEYPDRRIKGIVYTMASSGIRLGAWDYLRWKEIQPIERQGKLVAAKIIVYAGDDEEYFSFITPEALSWTSKMVHTSNGSIAYTGDIRFHGRRSKSSEKFIQKCSESDIDVLLCEGTRIKEESSKNELDVERDVKTIVNNTENLVICNYPPRDLDRLLSIYNAVKETSRYFVIDLKQAYLLKLFQNSEKWKGVYPSPNDKNIKIYIPRRGWGLIDKDINIWTKKQVLQDYLNWVDEFIDYPNSIFFKQIRDGKQNEFLFYCSDLQIQELIDIRPKDHSAYIRSSTEPFNEETKLDQIKVKKWLSHFGLLNNVDDWYQVHVSGHGSQDQLKKILQDSNSKRVIPVHTENEDYYYKWHNNVTTVNIDNSIEF